MELLLVAAAVIAAPMVVIMPLFLALVDLLLRSSVKSV